MNRTYRLLSAWPLPVALALVGCLQVEAQQVSYSCADANDPHANAIRDYVVALVTAPANSRNAEARDAHQLPVLSAGDVSIEKKPPLCRAAGAAYHQVIYGGAPEIDRDLILIQAGDTRYVVLDNDERPSESEYANIMVFDDSWQYLTAWTG